MYKKRKIIMKVLFIITGSDKHAWLSEITHPFWHLMERGIEVDFTTLEGGKIYINPWSDPYAQESIEPNDLVSKGFLSDKTLVEKLMNTLKLKDMNLDDYDGVHIAGGLGAAFDLYPNEQVRKTLEHFWENDKVIGAICHGSIALANNPDRIEGRRVTGYTREEDAMMEEQLTTPIVISNYPQTVLEEAGAIFMGAKANADNVIVEKKLVTGQNPSSASDYGIALLHLMIGRTPVVRFD
jgi:putative intracellular protease/amidase